MADAEETALRITREKLLENALQGATPQVDARGLLTDPEQLRKAIHFFLEVTFDFLANPWMRPMMEGVMMLSLRAMHDLVCDEAEEKTTEEQTAWQPSSPFSPLT